MGACASRFTVLKNSSTAPPPDLKNEVEYREVNPVEEVEAKKDDVAAVEDEESSRQSLGHLLSENEEKVSAESDETKGRPEADVVDAPAQGETEKAPVADDLKLKGLEKEIMACQNVAMEAETVKIETKEKVEPEKSELQLEEVEGETLKTGNGEKPAEVSKCETSEKAPEAPQTEVENPASDAEKKETEEETKELEEPVVTEEQNPTEEKPIETSDKKSESSEEEKTKQKQGGDAEKSETEEKPAVGTKVGLSDKVEDKHVLEPQTKESCSSDNTASDAEKPKAEEENANN